MATSLSTAGPHLTRFLQPIRAHNPNGISVGSAVFAQMTTECPYTLQWNAPFSPQCCRFPCGDLDPHLKHGSLGPPESSSSTQMASRSVQPFLQSSLLWQTDRPRYSVGNNRPHLRCGLKIDLTEIKSLLVFCDLATGSNPTQFYTVHRKQIDSHTVRSKCSPLARTQALKRVGHCSTASLVSDCSKPHHTCSRRCRSSWMSWTWQWRHISVTCKINKIIAYLQRAFIPVSRYVKIIKIHQHHQHFPELWSQMYCHVFYELQCTLIMHYWC